MKKQLLTFILSIASLIGFAQTAVNFNCNDCSGTPHDLFAELDAGTVVVLDFVMPCGACIAPAQTAYNVVQSYAASDPGRVKLYLSDDVGTTLCSTLNSWANTNSVTPDAVFSNTGVVQSQYGTGGMPKIVVVGGTNHTVYFNQNGSAAGNSTGLTNAINSALLATSVNDPGSMVTSLNVFPNPAQNTAEVKFNLVKAADVIVELFNLQGQKLNDVFSGMLSAGENQVKMNMSDYDAGMYLVKLTTEGKSSFINVTVAR